MPNTVPDRMTRLIHVAAAVIRNPAGEILLARRPEDKHQGGLWEFPGGKVEAGEPVYAALARELEEELGICIRNARPLIQIPHHYPDKSVLLDVYEVTEFSGEPWGREGQPVRWVSRQSLSDYQFPAANVPIVQAARLPERLLITGRFEGVEDALRKLQRAADKGIGGVMLRAKHLDDLSFAELAVQFRQHCEQLGLFLTLNCSVEQANRLGAAALHLSSARLMALDSREAFSGQWLSASCHNEQELAHAQRIGVDFVTLSPLLPTASHPGAPVLGWQRFAELAANATLPVFGLGGLVDSDLEKVREAGGQGIAAISAWWE